MNAEQLLVVKELFLEVSVLPEERWQAFLDERADLDGEVRAWVEEQLQELGRTGTWCLPPVQLGGALGLEPGESVDGYKLLERIGEGGFGVVWMAQQSEPVERKVALKVIKAGMDTEQVVRRFEAERQALAIMDHPGIARVLDGGTTTHGRPYFVMELVRGIPITEYCDQAQASPQERIELFQEVCHAVQHAHQKGVIHRDIKPSNVLVTEIDGRPSPKVIDFGIAKATSAELTHKTLFTSFGQMIGTPDYMAPEQTALSGVDVDTRADIYSLGVLLYELLVGSRPFSGPELLAHGYEEMLRVVREVDPPSPSTRARSQAEGALVLGHRGCASAVQLSRQLAGDLDWIVMKALEKQRDRRYDTPDALAEDLARHLRHEPVLASPPTLAYRMRKYVRRNRIPVFAGSAITLSLMAGAIFALLFALRARDQRNAADAARESLASLVEVLKGRDPFLSDDQLVSSKEALDLAAGQVEQAFPDQPLQRIELHKFLGAAYWRIGELGAALEQMDIAADELRLIPDVPALRRRSVCIPRVWMRHHWNVRNVMDDRPLQMWEVIVESVAAGDPELVRIAREVLAWSHRWRFPIDSARALQRVALLEESLVQQGASAQRWAALGDLVFFAGRSSAYSLGHDEGYETWLQRAEAIYRGPAELRSTHMLLALLEEQRLDYLYTSGQLGRLRERARGQAQVYGAVLPPDHWLLSAFRGWEALARASLGEDPEAMLPILRESFGHLEELLGPGHWQVRSLQTSLVEVAQAVGAPDAEELRIELVMVLAWGKNFGSISTEVLDTLLAGDPLVDSLRELHRLWTEVPYSEAYGHAVRTLIIDTVQDCEMLSADEAAVVARWMMFWADSHLEKSGDNRRARLHLREMYEFVAGIDWPEDLSIGKTVRVEQGQLFWHVDEDAEKALASTRAGLQKNGNGWSHTVLGLRLIDAGQPEEGFVQLEEGYRLGREFRYPLSVFAVYACRNLMQGYVSLGEARGELEAHLRAGARVASAHLAELLRGGAEAGSLQYLAWAVVRASGLEREHYEVALAAAQEGFAHLELFGEPATRLPADLERTYALAKVRLGHPEEALPFIHAAIEARSALNLTPLISNDAILALILAETGEQEEARTVLEGARMAAANMEIPVTHALIAEAEARLR